MMRGYSLKQDLKSIIDNPKYSDVEILCKDGKKLYGCRAILAARSEVFDRLLYNGMKESYERQITFPETHSSEMEIILEYIYTGMVKGESLTEDNIVEAFRAADYFQLPELQDCITRNVMNTLKRNYKDNYSPELLTKIVDNMPPTGDDTLLNLLVETVATIPLNTIEFGRLSIAALQCLLSYRREHEKEDQFATPEYEVFRYSVILAARQVSNDAYETFMERLLALEQGDAIRMENDLIVHRHQIAEELEPLMEFIDLDKIKGQIIVDVIEPLQIVPLEMILSVYRKKIKSNGTDLSKIRRPPPNFDNRIAGLSKDYIYDSLENDIWYINSINARKGCGTNTRNGWDPNARHGWSTNTHNNWCNPLH